MSLVRSIIVPLYDFFTQTKSRQYLKFLEKSQWFTPEKLRENQEKSLKQLIHHAYDTVPYYHRIFNERGLKADDIKTVEDLGKLPVLKKGTIMHNWNNNISNYYPRRKLILSNTGGSTGETLRFYVTKENREWSWATRLRSYRWAGFEVGDRYAYLWGLRIDVPRFTSFRSKIENVIRKRLLLNCFLMTEQTLKEYARKLIAFKPKVIYGYAHFVYLLAKFIEQKGLDGIEVEAVITDSQKLLDHERSLIEKVFGCKVWDHYHNLENGTFAAECSEHSGYHLNVENHILEFVRDGEQVAPREMGAILVTDLRNYGMPFIRYDNGDIGSPGDSVCQCGRSLPIMSSIYGRHSDVLVSKDGRFVFFPFYNFDDLLMETKIKQYQIIQETYEKFVIRLVIDERYAGEETENIMKIMHNQFGEDIDVEFDFVESIPPSKSGKHRFIVSKVPIEFTKAS